MQLVRTILHRALVDQTTSLQGMLAAVATTITTAPLSSNNAKNAQVREECKEAMEWNQFALDLQHSLRSPNSERGSAASAIICRSRFPNAFPCGISKRWPPRRRTMSQ